MQSSNKRRRVCVGVVIVTTQFFSTFLTFNCPKSLLPSRSIILIHWTSSSSSSSYDHLFGCHHAQFALIYFNFSALKMYQFLIIIIRRRRNLFSFSLSLTFSLAEKSDLAIVVSFSLSQSSRSPEFCTSEDIVLCKTVPSFSHFCSVSVCFYHLIVKYKK